MKLKDFPLTFRSLLGTMSYRFNCTAGSWRRGGIHLPCRVNTAMWHSVRRESIHHHWGVLPSRGHTSDVGAGKPASMVCNRRSTLNKAVGWRRCVGRPAHVGEWSALPYRAGLCRMEYVWAGAGGIRSRRDTLSSSVVAGVQTGLHRSEVTLGEVIRPVGCSI